MTDVLGAALAAIASGDADARRLPAGADVLAWLGVVVDELAALDPSSLGDVALSGQVRRERSCGRAGAFWHDLGDGARVRSLGLRRCGGHAKWRRSSPAMVKLRRGSGRPHTLTPSGRLARARSATVSSRR